MKYTVSAHSDFGICEFTDRVSFRAKETSDSAFFQVDFYLEDWEKDTFVFMPACAYNGNRFEQIRMKYPPRYKPEHYGVDNKPLVGVIPSMGENGEQELEVTSADMAVPCVGIYYREKREAMFIMTPQQVKGGNIGYTVSKGRISLSYPANRKKPYYSFNCEWCNTVDEKGIPITEGEEITSPVWIEEFPCENFDEFYKKFFRLRKSKLDGTRAPNMYTETLWQKAEAFNNRERWSGETYPRHNPWHCGGWCDGSGIETSAFLKKGSALSKKRAIQALDFDIQPAHQTPAGFMYTMVKDGAASGQWHLTRFSAMTLYHSLRCFELTEPKQAWIGVIKKLADAFVTLFARYGKFGSYINSETGEMLIGYGSAGVGAIGGLAEAYRFFGDERYLNTAIKAAEYYRSDFFKTGMTCGGPGDILSAPDSESAFMTLESYIALYEVTGDKKWLDFSETLACYCSSWVVSYIHKFPEDSEMHRLGVNTVGSVFASVQNAHSAPGICTLSGDSIYKLYQFTGNQEYLALIKDIAYFIPQCMSTNERPITAYMGEPEGVNRKLPEGWICERVNTSDWERCYNGTGNVFYSNCWCSNALLLSFADLMGYPEFMPVTDE